jgi:hypothetical protein
VRKNSRPLVMRLPVGLREQSAWIFIGILCAAAGLSYLTGIAESTSITRVLNPTWLRLWGGFLLIAGSLVTASTWVSNKPLERLSLRLLSLGLLVYMGWVLAAVPLSRATWAATTCLSMVALSEIRVAVLRAVLRPRPPDSPEARP